MYHNIAFGCLIFVCWVFSGFIIVVSGNFIFRDTNKDFLIRDLFMSWQISLFGPLLLFALIAMCIKEFIVSRIETKWQLKNKVLIKRKD